MIKDQELFFKDKILKHDDRTLAKCGIRDGSEIDLSLAGEDSDSSDSDSAHAHKRNDMSDKLGTSVIDFM